MREPIHPGETPREDLDALDMNAAVLARRIEVPVNRITEIFNGRRSITGDKALRPRRFFGTPGECGCPPPPRRLEGSRPAAKGAL